MDYKDRWSPEREEWYRGRILLHTGYSLICGLCGIIVFLASMVKLSGYLAAAGIALLVFAVHGIGRAGKLAEELGEESRMERGQYVAGSGILANKPRSLPGLTQWIEVQPADDVVRIFCPNCSRWFIRTDFQWFPNNPDPDTDGGQAIGSDADPVDAAGGRFVKLCPCGRGLYYLGAE
jgi:hypothetical protein